MPAGGFLVKAVATESVLRFIDRIEQSESSNQLQSTSRLSRRWVKQEVVG
jgi:hypothetical protein